MSERCRNVGTVTERLRDWGEGQRLDRPHPDVVANEPQCRPCRPDAEGVGETSSVLNTIPSHYRFETKEILQHATVVPSGGCSVGDDGRIRGVDATCVATARSQRSSLA